MTQLVMAYLQAESIASAVKACASADCVLMDESVLYWEFVSQFVAKSQNVYIVDELLATIGTEPEQPHYHVVKWDRHHNAFLVLFASNFVAEEAMGARLAPDLAFFESHMTTLLGRMSGFQMVIGHSPYDGTMRGIARSEAGFIYVDGSGVITNSESKPIIKRMWTDNNLLFSWYLELASIVNGVGEPIFINRNNYHAIMAR